MKLPPPFLLAATMAPSFTMAQTDCAAQTDCGSCLGNGCAWFKDGTCAEVCTSFPNIECYHPRIFQHQNAQQICAVADSAELTATNEACFQATTANTCLQQASQGCEWLTGLVEGGTQGGWCVYAPDFQAVIPPCTAATNCQDCLSDSNCVWHNDGDNATASFCQTSCDDFPNPNCYYHRMFGVEANDAGKREDICQVNTTHNQLCFAENSSETCFASSEKCSWASGIGPDGQDGTTWCIAQLGVQSDENGSGSSARVSFSRPGISATVTMMGMVPTISFLFMM